MESHIITGEILIFSKRAVVFVETVDAERIKVQDINNKQEKIVLAKDCKKQA